MACRKHGVASETAVQQIWEVSSGESGSDSDSESDVLDRFSLNSTDDSSDSESGNEDGGINIGSPIQTPQDQTNAIVWDWKQPAVQPCSLPFTAISVIKVPLNEDSTKLQIFQQFVMDDILDAITRETNMYYTQHPKPTSSMRHNTSFYDTTSKELKAFLGTSIMMGVVRKPDLHLYWSKDGMLETPFFRKTIPRDRYVNIMSNLHFNSNALDNGSDRLFKIRPILNSFTENFCTSYCPDQHISVDESLLKFHGRLKFKQYNPCKRSRFGVKLYRLCESSGEMCGYTWNFKVYSGQDKDKNNPASTKVVIELSKKLLGLGYTIYLDNWYSSPNLYYTLLHQKTYAVGTVRLSRKNMPKRFPGRKLKKTNAHPKIDVK